MRKRRVARQVRQPASRTSAICTAFSAAPLRRLSPVIQRLIEPGSDGSSRTRPTSTGSMPAASSGVGIAVAVVDQPHAGRVAQQLDRLGLATSGGGSARWPTPRADVHRHAHARDGAADVVVVEDLARLADHLPLLRRVALLPSPSRRAGSRCRRSASATPRPRRPARRACPRARSSSLRPDELRPLRVELVQADLPRARHRLVRRHDHAVDPRRAVQRRERGDRDHRRAVRARRDALRHDAQVVGVHLGDHERDVGIHAERGRVVDRPARPRPRPAAPTPPRAARRRRRSRGRGRRSSPARSTSHVDLAAARTAACGPSDRGDAYARSSDTGNARSSRMRNISVPTRPVAPMNPTLHRSTAHLSSLRRVRTRCAAPAPPRSTSSSATTHEIRIVDVLIISMLMPSVASTSNILAAMPGLRLHARADERDPADVLVGAVAASPRSRRRSSPCTTRARERSVRGTVNEMSVWPAVDTFCTIMSTLTPASASARNNVAATPGRSGTCSIVTLASRRVVRDARDDRLLHRCHRRILLGDPGARRPGEARTNVHLHVVVARELDRPQREHAAAGRRHLEHLVERDARRACAPCGTMRGSAVYTPSTSV